MSAPQFTPGPLVTKLGDVPTQFQHEYQLKRLMGVRDELASISPRLRLSGGRKEVEAALKSLDKAIRNYPLYSNVLALAKTRGEVA